MDRFSPVRADQNNEGTAGLRPFNQAAVSTLHLRLVGPALVKLRPLQALWHPFPGGWLDL